MFLGWQRSFKANTEVDGMLMILQYFPIPVDPELASIQWHEVTGLYCLTVFLMEARSLCFSWVRLQMVELVLFVHLNQGWFDDVLNEGEAFLFGGHAKIIGIDEPFTLSCFRMAVLLNSDGARILILSDPTTLLRPGARIAQLVKKVGLVIYRSEVCASLQVGFFFWYGPFASPSLQIASMGSDHHW